MSFSWRTALGAGAALLATGLLTGPFAAPALATGSTDIAVTIESVTPQKAGKPWGVVVDITSSKPTSTLRVTFTEPVGVEFYEGPFENEGWICKHKGHASSCSAYGGKKRTTHKAVFAFIAPKDGSYSFTAKVTSAETDTDPANNTASTTVIVGTPPKGTPPKATPPKGTPTKAAPTETPPTEAAPTQAPPTGAAPASAAPSPSAEEDLPDTGYEVRNMALVGTALIAVGAVLMRRRRTS